MSRSVAAFAGKNEISVSIAPELAICKKRIGVWKLDEVPDISESNETSS